MALLAELVHHWWIWLSPDFAGVTCPCGGLCVAASKDECRASTTSICPGASLVGRGGLGGVGQCDSDPDGEDIGITFSV